MQYFQSIIFAHSETKSCGLVNYFCIQTMKWITLEKLLGNSSSCFFLIKACRLKHSIKKHSFCFDETEFIEFWEGGGSLRLLFYIKQRSLMPRIVLFSDRKYFLLTWQVSAHSNQCKIFLMSWKQRQSRNFL